MSKKRRMFDVDLPDDLNASEAFDMGETVATKAATSRRGPMATAISENAESLKEREEIEAQIRSENDALAHEHVRLKKLGLIVDLVPIEDVATDKLVRDRITTKDHELAELKSSIAEIGLSNPIRVEQRTDGKYELVQGMRRLTAFRELLAETKDAKTYGRIPAGIIANGDTIDDLYRKMVDENLVRKDISFAEMALLASSYAADPATKESDPDKAVAILFKAASYQKRSYIRAFIKLMGHLEETLNFPQEIPRALGLSLLSRIEDVSGIPAAIRKELRDSDSRSVGDELDVLRKFASGGQGAETLHTGKSSKAKLPRSAKTTFQIVRPEGAAKCTASSGRLEIKLARDFSALDRRKLEMAVARLLDEI